MMAENNEQELWRSRLVFISEEILQKLLAFKKVNPNFTFALRERDSPQSEEERLTKGQWFQGSGYIYVPLFKRGDKDRKVKTIGFVISFNDDGSINNNFIEISFKRIGGDSQQDEVLHRELASKLGIQLNDYNMGRRYYEHSDKYLANLDKFLAEVYPITLELIKKHGLADKYVVDEDTFQKRLAKINDIKRTLVSDSDFLKTGQHNNNFLMPLNQILYGPPGTGKTYNSINHAVSILESKTIENVASESRIEVKKRFDQYQNEGRIIFTTFHQSMSYEDFIEGIKPKVFNDEVIYQIEHGLFKRISIDAAFSITQLTDSKEAKKVLTFYQLYDQMVSSIEETLSNENAKAYYPTKSGGQVQIAGISEQGNILVRHINGERVYTVSKERLAKLDQAIANLDDVSNIDTEFREIIGGSNSSAYWAVLRTLRTLKPQGSHSKGEYSIEDKLAAVKTLKPVDFQRTDLKPYVIIIDEINRGNISQIFGELITLIEDDKRLGKKEAIETTLPYSKDKYGVPPNLYIIGTMNTADRSIEALDTALRRRFSFHEKAVAPELIRTEGASKGLIESIDVVKMLETINQRIEKLIDKDHQIGHAYFMDCQTIFDLKVAFQNKVIPLLQEYFFGDFGKIGLVLGNDFVVKQDNNDFSFARFKGFDDDGSVAEDLRVRAVYKIKDQRDWNFSSIYG